MRVESGRPAFIRLRLIKPHRVSDLDVGMGSSAVLGRIVSRSCSGTRAAMEGSLGDGAKRPSPKRRGGEGSLLPSLELGACVLEGRSPEAKMSARVSASNSRPQMR